MVPAKIVHRKLDRLLNRVASDHDGTYTVKDKDDAINRAIRLWQENVTALAETNLRFRGYLNPLLITRKELEKVDSNSEFDTFAYPSDYYRRLRQETHAKTEHCDVRKIRTIVIQRDDLTKIEDDPFWNSSFEWAETFALESRKGLEVYHQKVFDITKVYIDYYHKIPLVLAPELVDGVYEHPATGEVITQNQNFFLDDDTLRPILDLAAVFLRIARGDSVELQLEMSKIFNIEKSHLN